MLGLLDARTVVGDDSLTSALRSSALSDWRSLARDRLPQLREASEQRAQQFGDLAHLLEPDLKDSSGGIRDVVVLRAVAASWVADIPHGMLAEPHAHLLNVRDALHHSDGRGVSDRLTLQDQSAVAQLLGMADADELLRSVSSSARAVQYARDVTWNRVDRVIRLARASGPVSSKSTARRLEGSRASGRTPLAEGVVVQEGEVVLSRDADPSTDPVLVLRAAAAAAQAGLSLAPHAVQRLAAESAPMPQPWPLEARDSLVSLLGAGRRALPVWEALDQANVWGTLIPEWEILRSAPQRNALHTYTVDRHLVEAAIEASLLAREVRRPDLLIVGALLHDVGKARGGDHTDIGIEIVQQIAPRMGFDEADSAVLVDMVRHHLLLPDVATRRDLDDPATIEFVAERIDDSQELELLAALTRADSLATGPAAWSDWKAQLVDSLVQRVDAKLGGQPAIAQPTFNEAELAWAREAHGVEVVLEARDSVHRLLISTADSVGLMSTTAGVLSLHRLGVRAASTRTLGDRVLAVWTVQPTFGDLPPVERVREDLQRALEGTLDVGQALAHRDSEQRIISTAPPAVQLVSGASERSTVLEVRAHDAPGLLYRVTAAISAQGVDIAEALVTTLGSEVVDAFYLRSAAGDPLDADQAQSVHDAVLGALSG
jgi:[protein-PII] uridylyltransferase